MGYDHRAEGKTALAEEISASQGPVGEDEGQREEGGHRQQNVFVALLPKQRQLLLRVGTLFSRLLFSVS